MESLLRQYVSMVPVKSIQWPQGFIYSVPEQTSVFQEVLCSSLSKSYPPSHGYQMHFTKHVMTSAEEHGHSVAAELYELYAALMAVPEAGKPDFCYKSYCIDHRKNRFVTMKESTKLISRGTTGLTTWQAAFYFVEWACDHDNLELFRGKSLLELGSGLGFTGIALCHLCRPSGYVFTDCHDDVLHMLKENVALNLTEACSTKAKVNAFNWEGSIEQFLSCLPEAVDYIIATDVVYDTDVIDRFVLTIHKLFSQHVEAVAFVASTIRNPATYKHFCEKLDTLSIRWKVMEKANCEVFYYDRSLPIEILQLSL